MPELVTRALTLLQPWASLVVFYGKDIENRRWVPPSSTMGQPLYIHAGKRWDDEGWHTAVRLTGGRLAPYGSDAYPRGVVLGRVTLANHHWSSACARGMNGDLHPDGPYECSRWAMGGNGGMSHWYLADPVALPEPVPCRGFQRLWTLPPEVAEQATAQLVEIKQQEENG